MVKSKRALLQENTDIAGKNDINFETLVNAIVRINADAVAQATKAVNMGLTIRNWLFGYYIVDPEKA